jgi:hypothetical protein
MTIRRSKSPRWRACSSSAAMRLLLYIGAGSAHHPLRGAPWRRPASRGDGRVIELPSRPVGLEITIV